MAALGYDSAFLQVGAAIEAGVEAIKDKSESL